MSVANNVLSESPASILVNIPIEITKYLPPTNQSTIPEKWDISHNFWLQSNVCINLCKKVLDLRTSAQSSYFNQIKLKMLSYSGDIPVKDDKNGMNSLEYSDSIRRNPLFAHLYEELSIENPISTHKLVVDYFKLKYGNTTTTLDVAQHRILLFLESLLQYASLSPIIKLVKVLLIPKSAYLRASHYELDDRPPLQSTYSISSLMTSLDGDVSESSVEGYGESELEEDKDSDADNKSSKRGSNLLTKHMRKISRKHKKRHKSRGKHLSGKKIAPFFDVLSVFLACSSQQPELSE